MRVRIQNSHSLLPPSERKLIVVSSCVFSDVEIEKIESLAKTKCHQASATGFGENSVVSPDVRKSKVGWVDPVEWKWVYDRLWHHIKEVNAKHFGANINDLRYTKRQDCSQTGHRLQISHYEESESSHYTWHLDVGGSNWSRKLSIVVQLSDGESYGGGVLQTNHGSGPQSLSKQRGTVIIFPSWILHRVTPVTCGSRYSLVGWYPGQQWR
jgi:PKHD-type hydroxylase